MLQTLINYYLSRAKSKNKALSLNFPYPLLDPNLQHRDNCASDLLPLRNSREVTRVSHLPRLTLLISRRHNKRLRDQLAVTERLTC